MTFTTGCRARCLATLSLLALAGNAALAQPARPRVAAVPRPPPVPAPASAPAADTPDRAELERTRIIGNRELPRVLYIVPWKKPPLGTLGGRPTLGVMDDALAPIDREVLQRQIRYDAQIRASAAAPAPTSNSPASPQ